MLGETHDHSRERSEALHNALRDFRL